MPETIRTANGGLRSCPRRGGILAAFVSVTSVSAIAPAQADGLMPAVMHGVAALGYGQTATVTLLLNLAWFAVLACVLLRQRRALSDGEHLAREERSALRAECDRLKALLTAEPQVLIAWAAGAEIPEIIGDSALILQGEAQRVLAFGSWLDPASAQQIDHAVDDLRAKGRAFVMNLTTRSGRPVEADGRAIGGVATLRLRDVSGLERELADLENRHEQLANDVATMRGLLDALSAPVWARDADGRLIFVNFAYARAVEGTDAGDAVARELELLDCSVRADVARSRKQEAPYIARIAAVARGERRIFDVIDSPGESGSAGIAIDRTETEDMRA